MYNDTCVDSKTQEMRDIPREVIVIDISFISTINFQKFNAFLLVEQTALYLKL